MVHNHFIRFTKLLGETNGEAANNTTATKRDSLAAFPKPQYSRISVNGNVYIWKNLSNMAFKVSLGALKGPGK